MSGFSALSPDNTGAVTQRARGEFTRAVTDAVRWTAQSAIRRPTRFVTELNEEFHLAYTAAMKVAVGAAAYTINRSLHDGKLQGHAGFGVIMDLSSQTSGDDNHVFAEACYAATIKAASVR